jgi:hypothetical protein
LAAAAAAIFSKISAGVDILLSVGEVECARSSYAGSSGSSVVSDLRVGCTHRMNRHSLPAWQVLGERDEAVDGPRGDSVHAMERLRAGVDEDLE